MVVSSNTNYKVVYLEDDYNIRNLMFEILNPEFNIITTGSYDEAMELCMKDDVAIVLADHHMKPKTGLEFLKILYQKRPEIRRVIVTGDKSSDLIIRAINEGHINGFFHKPIEFPKLRDGILDYLDEFEDNLSKNQREEILQEEVTKLQQALYQRNSKLFHSLSEINQSSAMPREEKLTELYVAKISKTTELWENEHSKDNLDEIYLTLEEFSILTEEFHSTCINLWVDLLKICFSEYRTPSRSTTGDITKLKKQVSSLPKGPCKSNLVGNIDDLIILYKNKTMSSRVKSDQYASIITNSLATIKLLMIDPENISSETDIFATARKDLGYIIVVVNQVTVYTKLVEPRTDVNPALIGNLAIAVNDFSKELFDEFSGVQLLEQENGLMLIHRASEDIYYIAMAYKDSYFYNIWLQELANRTLDLFLGKADRLTFEEEEIDWLDSVVEDILTM